METHLECIRADSRILCYIVRAEFSTAQTRFITPHDCPMQLGFVAYPAGGTVKRHRHKQVARSLTGTSEALVVKSGRCRVDIYDDDKHLVAERELGPGDVLLLIGGGHGL